MAEQRGQYELPSFPTQFTESDQTRLDELKGQKKMLQDLYSQHYVPDVWAAKPAAERYLRTFGSIVGVEGALHALRGVVPGEALQWGLTPEKASLYRMGLEDEYAELTRRQKVAEQSANIINDIRLLALSGNIITDTTELLSRFPELRDWKDDEVAYITSFAQGLIGKTPEQIAAATGEVPELTPDMIRQAFAEKPSKVSPEHILSAVAFSKDMNAIKQALTAAFPPEETAPLSEDEVQQTQAALQSAQEQQLEALGLTPQEGETMEDLMQRKHEVIAAGKDITLQDVLTGMMVTGTLSEGNLVWVDDELLGYLDEETGFLLAVGLDGTVFKSVFEEESWLRDNVLDSFSVGAIHMGQGIDLAATTGQTIHDMVAGVNPAWMLEKHLAGDAAYMKYWEGQVEKISAHEQEAFMRLIDRQQQWWAEHPELAPRPEYALNPFEHPELFRDSGWWASTLTSSLAYSLSILGTMAAVTSTTGSLPAGIGAGFMLASGPEAGSMIKELVEAGVPFEEAVKWGYLYGAVVGIVETASSLPLLGLVFKPMKAVTKGFWDKLLKRFASRAVRAAVAGITVIAVEDAEEVITSATHDAILDIYTDVSLSDYLSNMSNAFIRTTIATIPFALWGGTSNYRHFTNALSADLQKEIADNITRFETAGATHEEAQVLAVQEAIKKEGNATEVASVLEAFRKAHDEFVALSSEDRADFVSANPDAGIRELQISAAHDKLIDKEIEYTKGEIEKATTSLEAGELGPAPQALLTQLEEKLAELDREKAMVTGRTEELRGLLSENSETRGAVIPTDKEISTQKRTLSKDKAHLNTITEHLKTLAASRQTHLDRVASLIASKGSQFEIQTEKEAITSLDKEIRSSGLKETALNKKVASVEVKLGEMETARAKEAEKPVAAIPMTVPQQKSFLADAAAILTQDPNAGQEGMHVIEEPGGQMLIVTNAKGEVLVAAQILMREGKMTLSNIVKDKEKKTEATKTAQTIYAYLDNQGVAVAPRVEMTDDGARAFKTWLEGKDTTVSGMGWSEDVVDRLATEDVARAIKSRFMPSGQPQTVDGVPTIDPWNEERLAVSEAMAANTKLADSITRPIIREAGKLWDAMSQEDRIAWGKEIGLSKEVVEELASKKWKGIPPTHRERLTLGGVRDNSLHAPKLNLLLDKRYIFQWLEEKTGLSFYSLFKRIEAVHAMSKMIHEEVLDKVDRNPEFRAILRDKEALLRVEQELSSRNPDLKVESPENITITERQLADVFEAIFKSYEPKVRYLRFLREYEEHGNLDGVYDAIIGKMKLSPAEEALIKQQLQQCIDYYNLGDYKALWAYVQDKEWGVIGSGYTPWMVMKPELFPRTLPVSSTRGAARLIHREGVEFPSGMKTFIQRFGTYIKQIETYFYLRPELQRLDTMLKDINPKMDADTRRSVEANMRSFTRELQGLPPSEAHITSMLKRVLRQAMATVFLHPYLAFRNLYQHLSFFPYRSELFRYLISRPPAAFRTKMDIYYKYMVAQMAAIRRDYMYSEEKGFLPGTEPLVRLAHRLSLYPLSDNIPRMWSAYAAMSKAHRAAMQYQKDGDIKKWEKNSGVLHLTRTEQNHAKELLMLPTKNLGIKGLREVTGAEASSLFIGHEIANGTHFVYERAFRAEIEQGGIGRIMFNLLVFPRSYAQRIIFQAKKLTDKEASWTEKRMALKDIVLIMIVGSMVSEWLTKITKRPRRSYNPFDILRWDLGGLAIGVPYEIINMLGTVMAAVSPWTDEEYKKRAIGQLPGLLSRNTQVLIPFLRILLDNLEALTGTKNIDTHAYRLLIKMVYGEFKVEELERMEMTLADILTKMILGGEPSDPGIFTQGQTDIVNRESELGQVDADGRFYTLRNFASDIETAITGIPDDMLTPEYGWSEKVMYYMDYRDEWMEFQKITTVSKAGYSPRDDYRRENLEFNTWLCFWGFYSRSLYKYGSSEWTEFSSLIATLFDYYGIDASMHPKWADWTLPIVAREP